MANFKDCDESYNGLHYNKAVEKAKQNGLEFRVVEIEGNACNIDTTYNSNRINVYLKNNFVFKNYIG